MRRVNNALLVSAIMVVLATFLFGSGPSPQADPESSSAEVDTARATTRPPETKVGHARSERTARTGSTVGETWNDYYEPSYLLPEGTTLAEGAAPSATPTTNPSSPKPNKPGAGSPTASAPDQPPGQGAFGIPLPTSPDGDPPGANDWNCKPTERRPTPVILVHGTGGDRKHLLEKLSETIKANGYCVFSLDYGNRALGPIEDSAVELKAYVAKVRTATGAAKVSMVGHSQGGMMPRYYIKFLGGARYVEDLVGIAPSNHGTTALDFASLLLANDPGISGAACQACMQQRKGSAFLTKLNAGDESPGEVSYTQITTAHDEVVTPHTSGYLAAAPNVTNLTLQNVCPLDISEHLLIPTSKVTVAWTIDALNRKGPASAAVRPAC